MKLFNTYKVGRLFTAVPGLLLLLTLFSQGISAQGMDLMTAERIGLKNNFDLRVLRLERRLTQESFKESKREFFPSVSLSYRQNRTVAERDFDNGNYSVQLSVSQPIFDGGRTKLGYEIAKIDMRMSRADYRSAIRDLRFKIRKAYLDLQQTRASISVAKASMESATRVFEKAKLELKQGAITDLDFREIVNELDGRLLTYKKEKQSYSDKLEDFAHMLMIPPENIKKLAILDFSKLRVKSINKAAKNLEYLARRNYPELKRVKIALAKSKKEYLISKYSYLPKVSLTGHYGKSGDEWPPRTTEWGVGFNVSFAIMGSTLSNDMNSNYSRASTTRNIATGGQLSLYDNAGWRKPHIKNSIELMKVRKKYRDTLRNIKIQVRRSVRDFRNRERELRSADEQLAIRELRFKIDKIKYRNGEITVDKLFEEELKLINARLDLVKKRVESALMANQLEMELGLKLDSLGLVNFSEVKNEINKDEIIRRSWRPNTIIKLRREQKSNSTPKGRGNI